MPRVDYRFGEVGAGYTWNATDTSWYSRIDLDVELNHSEDQDGNLLEQEAAVEFTLQGPLESHATVEPSIHREGYGGEEFELSQLCSRAQPQAEPQQSSLDRPGGRRAGRLHQRPARRRRQPRPGAGVPARPPPPLRAREPPRDHGCGPGLAVPGQHRPARSDLAARRADLHPRHPPARRLRLQHRALQDGGARATRSSTRSCCSRTRSTRGPSSSSATREDSRGDATYDLTPAIRSVFVKLGYAWVP